MKQNNRPQTPLGEPIIAQDETRAFGYIRQSIAHANRLSSVVEIKDNLNESVPESENSSIFGNDG
ncbi:MAG: hypothetical protein E7544_01170 [Ruminococcaceae bacterium]|nr:hypothetical protein [Oscillospiraceae bacterium]